MSRLVLNLDTGRRPGLDPRDERLVTRPDQAKTAEIGLKDGDARDFGRWGRTGSAHNSWFSRVKYRKSLIVEKVCGAKPPSLATNQPVFAMSPVSSSVSARLFLSLFNLLKRKKNIGWEEGEMTRNSAPRVGAALPLVGDAAYFLGHELASHFCLNDGEIWHNISFKINSLVTSQTQTMSPRIVLPVPSSRREIGVAESNSADDLTFSAQEIYEATGYRQPVRQIRALSRAGIPVDRRPDGSARVWRHQVFGFASLDRKIGRQRPQLTSDLKEVRK